MLVPSALPSLPVLPSVVPGAALPTVSCPPLPRPDLKPAQLMPVCASLDSTTSTILASSITWRSIDTCTARRYCSTWRNSAGVALTSTTPAAGLSTTLRPPWLPTRAASEACTSRQKSASEVVRTCAESSLRLLMPLLLPGCPVLLPVLPVLPVLPWPPPATEIALDVTRMSEAPWRRPGR